VAVGAPMVSLAKRVNQHLLQYTTEHEIEMHLPSTLILLTNGCILDVPSSRDNGSGAEP
jgi:hypothetical protein